MITETDEILKVWVICILTCSAALPILLKLKKLQFPMLQIIGLALVFGTISLLTVLILSAMNFNVEIYKIIGISFIWTYILLIGIFLRLYD